MKIHHAAIRIVLPLVFITAGLHAQDDLGLPFLKIGLGARQAGMANVSAGVGDDIYTLYWNPGGLGHLRRWQWSLGYNRWFADVYQASFSFGKQIRMLGSHKTGIGISCEYVGAPSWDATGGAEEPTSFSHLVAGIALGQRLDWLHRTIAIGAQAKVIQSRLADYSDMGVATDIGLLFRSPRFRIGKWFQYGYISAGFSVANLGASMTFESEETKLPRTYRGGFSFLMGTYRNWRVLFASDWSQVIGSPSQWAFGTEVWWMDLLGARSGYRWNDDLGDFSIGIGFRWDDVMNHVLGLPSRFSDAFAIDLATVDYGEVLHHTYRGSVSHYPLAPEPFRLEEVKEVEGETTYTSWIKMTWEEAYDPDPFDEVRYLLVVDRLRGRINQTIQLVEKDYQAFWESGLQDSLLIIETLADTSYLMAANPGDVFYWAVAAYDLAHHARLAKLGREKVGKIVVPTADLLVSDFKFRHVPWISTTPEQGMFLFTVSNRGDKPAKAFRCWLKDKYVHPDLLWPEDSLLTNVYISGLDAGEDTTFQIFWNTTHNGPHIIEMMVDADSAVAEFQKYNNLFQELVYSIPKGQLLVPDAVEVVTTDYDSTDIPIVTEVYFEPNSFEVDPNYYTNTLGVPPILSVLSERLQDNPLTSVRISGYVDASSENESSDLADQRSRAVQEQLIHMGVPPEQLQVMTSHDRVIYTNNRHRTPEDAERVIAQNRVVRFDTETEFEETLFHPVSVAVDTSVKDRIPFQVRIVSPAYVANLFIGKNPIVIYESDDPPFSDSITVDLWWDGSDQNNRLVPRNQWYSFQATLEDTMGRQFYTPLDSIFLRERRTIRRQEVFGAAKFGKIEPVYQFYWDRMLDLVNEMAEDPKLTLRFEGHACVIGPEGVNARLSRQRARNFTQAFLEKVKETYPDRYANMRRRIETPVGYGESQPLIVKLKNYGQVKLGDNTTPVGRYLNRRISILLLRMR
ncbi:PorV/PorQ family protein [bacterium]|nr:PorV/PorQ family protein [bacterium]